MNEREQVAIRSGPAWVLWRALPLVLLAFMAGILVGWSRWGVGYLPGLLGMFWGGVVGATAGLFGRRDPPELWHEGQRFWMLLVVQTSFFFAMAVTLSILYRPPLASTLTWLRDVLGGSSGEPFFGASVYSPLMPVEGSLSGGGWIAFNLLDVFLFFFLGILVFGIVIEGAQARRSSASTSAPSHLSKPFARRFFMLHAVMLVILLVVLGAAGAR